MRPEDAEVLVGKLELPVTCGVGKGSQTVLEVRLEVGDEGLGWRVLEG